MANQLQRKGTSLIEITQEEAQKATTPAGTAAQGGTPAQAAASATPNGKAPVLAEAVDKTLQREQRLTPQGPSAEQQGAARQAQAKADRLRQLGSLGSRVDSLLEQRLQQQAATGPVSQSIDDSKLALEFPNDPTKQAQVRDALAAYLAAPPEGKEAALAALSTAAGTLVDPNRYLKSAAATVQGAVQAPPSQPVTMAEVGWGDLDPQQVAADLGLSVEDVNKLTPEQLSGAVAEVQAREFQQQRALAAELATASPQRKAQIWAELRAGQLAGVNATELAVDQLKGELVSDAEVEFNGQPYKLNDLLKSDVVSKEILKAAQDPEHLKALVTQDPKVWGPANPGEPPTLGDWIRSNVEALSELSKTQAAEATALGAVQTQLGTATEKFDTKLLEVLGVSVPEFATSEQVAQITQQLENSSVAQAVLADGTLSGVFTANPALVQQLAGETKEQILERKKLTDSIGQDATLTALLGYDPTTGMFTGDMASAKQMQTAYAQLASKASQISGDPRFLAAVKSGDITTPEQLLQIARYPDIFDSYQRQKELVDKINKAIQTRDGGLLGQALFGGADPTDLNSAYQTALRVPRGDLRKAPSKNWVEAQKLIDKMRSYADFNRDGRIDAADVNQLLNPSNADKLSRIANNNVDPKELLTRNQPWDALSSVKAFLNTFPETAKDIELAEKKRQDDIKAGMEWASQRPVRPTETTGVNPSDILANVLSKIPSQQEGTALVEKAKKGPLGKQDRSRLYKWVTAGWPKDVTDVFSEEKFNSLLDDPAFVGYLEDLKSWSPDKGHKAFTEFLKDPKNPENLVKMKTIFKNTSESVVSPHKNVLDKAKGGKII